MDPSIESLFIAYLEKTISPEKEKLLIEKLENNAELFRELYDYKKIWNSSEFIGKFSEIFVQDEWNRLLSKVNKSSKTRKQSRGIILYWLPRVAAVFLLGAIISFAITYQVFQPKTKNISFYEINTPAGAKSKITLPDGSNIWLNAGSSIKYSEQYGIKKREVFLTGEAFFEVNADRSKIFVVHTSELNIKAYGTEFNVKSYPEEGTIETTLIEGSIGVTRTRFNNKKDDEVILEPNQRVVYYRKNYKTKKPDNEEIAERVVPKKVDKPEQKLTYLISKGIKPEEFTSWKDGTLFITSETLEQLVIKLERKYDVKIHFQDENLKKLKFTGSLENETVEQVIEAIGIAAQIDYEIDEREIWLKNREK